MKKILLLLFFIAIPILAQETFWRQYIPELEGEDVKKILFNDDKSKLYILSNSRVYSYLILTGELDTILNYSGTNIYFDNNKLYFMLGNMVWSSDEGQTWNTILTPNRKVNNNIFVADNKIFYSRWYQNTWTPPPPPTYWGIWSTNGIGENLSYYSSSPFEDIKDIGGYYQGDIYYQQDNNISLTRGIFKASLNQSGIWIAPLSSYFVDTTNGQFYYSLNNYLYKKLSYISDSVISYNIGNVRHLIFSAGKSLAVTSKGFYYKPDPIQGFIRKDSSTSFYGNYLVIDKNNYILMASTNGVYISKSSIDNLVSVKDNEELPETFSLEQNYPNPFNPSTTIKFSLPEQNYVTIKVFDVLGREIKTLVNEEKPAGNYEVEFNATGLTSGIYFDRIDAGKYSETKKMLLMK